MQITGISSLNTFFSSPVASVANNTVTAGDTYSPDKISVAETYDMFGNIHSNIFSSFTNEKSFMSAIREVFDSVQDTVLTSDNLTEAAKISDKFEKYGEWLSFSEDKSIASISNAHNVYYDGSNSEIDVHHSDNVVLDSDDKDHTIRIHDSKNVISTSGSGKDRSLLINASNVIIDSGAGGDISEVFSSDDVIINSGDGNDGSLICLSNNVIMNTGDGIDYVTVDDSNNVYIDSGSGNDRINSSFSTNLAINSGDGDDSIEIIGSNNASIITGDGSDNIYLSTTNDTNILSGNGDDIINASGSFIDGDSITVDGGAGDDTITVESYGNAIINGGEGNDTITGTGIISGGTGDDYISLYHSLFEGRVASTISYSRGDGSDIVDGASKDTMIDMNGISEDEYDITDSVNENGTKVKTYTMKDGSGSITLIYGNNQDYTKKQEYDTSATYEKMADVQITDV